MAPSSTRQAILKVLSPGFGGTVLPDYMKKLLDEGLGAVTLFGSNTPDIETTIDVVGQIRLRNPGCLISIDEESGDVTRIWARTGSPFPSPYLLGRLSDPQITREVFRAMGSVLANIGIDITFGPVLDLAEDLDNPIVGIRAFSSDAATVAAQGLASIRGLTDAGVIATPKHFPGHGKTSADSHHDLPQINSSLEQLLSDDVKPFLASIESGVQAIMVGHLLVKSVDHNPASLSKVWCTNILREDLGFEGVIVTDALDMGALGGIPAMPNSALRAIRAGADLLCLSGRPDQAEMVESIVSYAENEVDESDLELLERSAKRLACLNHPSKPNSIEPLRIASALPQALEVIGSTQIDSNSVAVLSLEAQPTIAAGNIAWGIEESLLAMGCKVGEFDTAVSQIVQFRDAWRDPVILERLEMIRVEHPDAVFVDFGWPTRAFRAKNLIRAFGAGRSHADAVARTLTSQLAVL